MVLLGIFKIVSITAALSSTRARCADGKVARSRKAPAKKHKRSDSGTVKKRAKHGTVALR